MLTQPQAKHFHFLYFHILPYQSIVPSISIVLLLLTTATKNSYWYFELSVASLMNNTCLQKNFRSLLKDDLDWQTLDIAKEEPAIQLMLHFMSKKPASKRCHTPISQMDHHQEKPRSLPYSQLIVPPDIFLIFPCSYPGHLKLFLLAFLMETAHSRTRNLSVLETVHFLGKKPFLLPLVNFGCMALSSKGLIIYLVILAKI